MPLPTMRRPSDQNNAVAQKIEALVGLMQCNVAPPQNKNEPPNNVSMNASPVMQMS